MSNLENKLTEIGLKVWEKGRIKRVYIKDDTVKKLIDFETRCREYPLLEKNTKAIFQRINSEGAWLNCKTGRLESKKPTIQSWFEHSEFSEKFGY